MRRNRLAKIVATLGPSSSTPAQLRTLFETGVDVFRLNLSHGTQDEHRARHAALRALEEDFGRPICILVDLQGPKIRVGRFASESAELKPGAAFRLDLEDRPGDATRVQLPHPEVMSALVPGTDLLLDDGRLRLRVDRVGEGFAETTVVTGGTLKDRKGVNLPGVVLPVSPLTDKDRRDLAFALDLGIDWVALSFVQRPEDVAEARRLIAGRAAVM
ncbi:MAG: pyruvate kinase, partial [Dongiaceae bacterium]